MNFTFLAILLVVTTLPINSLQAAVVPGRWDKVAALEEGFEIVVTMEGWERIEGVFRGLTEDSLLLTRDEEKDVELPRMGVLKIESRDKPNTDSMVDGALIGALLGAGFSGIGVAVSQDDIPASEAFGVVALSTGLGAAIGLAGDAAIKSPDVFYKAAKK